MVAARGLAWAVILVMTLLAVNILVHDSLDHGAGLDVFLAGAGSPWQLFINQDLVSGLWLACGWILYRQRGARTIDAVAWIWMVMWWGNIVVAAYVLVALSQSGGEPARFFGSERASLPRWEWRPSRPVRALLMVGAGLSLVALAHLLGQAASGVATAGALLGLLPITLSCLLLAFPSREPKSPATA